MILSMGYIIYTCISNDIYGKPTPSDSLREEPSHKKSCLIYRCLRLWLCAASRTSKTQEKCFRGKSWNSTPSLKKKRCSPLKKRKPSSSSIQHIPTPPLKNRKPSSSSEHKHTTIIQKKPLRSHAQAKWCACFFFPSSDFYFLEEVRVQSGTPAPARERVAVRYFVEEMITGILTALLTNCWSWKARTKIGITECLKTCSSKICTNAV